MYIEQIPTEVYAGRIKNRKILNNSSSGGAFTAISDLFLSRGDAVVCAVYDYTAKEMTFQLMTTYTERNKALGSKYMQSKPGKIFEEAAEWLKTNSDKQLLFVGMGCQADGFRKYAELKGIRERVFIVDIVCHGSPSPLIWKKYAESLEQNHNGRIDYLTFKDKRNGWNSPTAFVKINGDEVKLNPYVVVFYSRCALRPSCHECLYATMERESDITIGDFWNIENTIPDFYDPAGNSLILVHTNRGKEVFEKLKPAIEYRKSNRIQCRQPNLESPTPVSVKRQMFWNDYEKHGVEYIMKKYGTISVVTKAKNKIIKLIRGGQVGNSCHADFSERRVA